MDGVFIYWFGWMLWIFVCFLLNKTKQRQWSSLFILSFLSVLPFKIEFSGMTIPIAFLLLSLILCWQIKFVPLKKLIYYLVVTWTIGTAYSAYQLMLLFDPIIELIDERWLSACLVSLLAAILVKSVIIRFQLAIFGLVQGDYLVSLAMGHLFHSNYEIGSLLFFDKIAIVGLIHGTLWGISCLSSWINRTPDSTTFQQSS